ncbi:uncharacterized protein [Antennarius striatus]|uniref:uncharacterized protein n=1 Tax=Antennarius striatus TaxID=241820 RepID=UPI0035B3054A
MEDTIFLGAFQEVEGLPWDLSLQDLYVGPQEFVIPSVLEHSVLDRHHGRETSDSDLAPALIDSLPDSLWTQGPTDVGRCDVTPVTFQMKPGPIWVPQYPVPAKEKKALESVITQPHIIFIHEGINMADGLIEGTPHFCTEKVQDDTKLRDDLYEQPLTNPDMTLFTDGCCFKGMDGLQSGFAIVQHQNDDFETVKEVRLDGPQSAQRAEILAVAEALGLAKDQTVNIYTDSAYAHLVVHTALSEWQRNNYQTATGSPIKHLKEVMHLQEMLMLPKAVAVIKCPGHSRKNDLIANGNAAADAAAKKVAGYQPALQLSVSDKEIDCKITNDVIREWQVKASPEERSLWKAKGGEKNDEGIWNKEGKPVPPQKQLKVLIQEAHGPCHVGTDETLRRLCGWWHPFMRTIVKSELQDCSVCNRHNCLPTTKPPPGVQDQEVTAPGQVISMDFTDMIQSVNGYRYLLVIVDSFSGWPEAYPCRAETAASVVKHLVNHYIPTHGFPRKIRSDNGTHFKNKHLQQVESMLGLRHTFGAVYHPQSQGKVERMNRNIKEKLSKSMASSKMNWLQALPVALLNVRMSLNSSTGWTPFEAHTNRPFPAPTAPLEPVPGFQGPKGLRELTVNFSHLTEPQEKPPKSVNVCEWVWLRVIKRKWSEPRWTGPHQVIERTGTAVRLLGRGDTWFHLTSTRPAKTPTGVALPSPKAANSGDDH